MRQKFEFFESCASSFLKTEVGRILVVFLNVTRKPCFAPNYFKG